jgi:hypothetical protein
MTDPAPSSTPDFSDPCATADWLRAIYYQRVAGQGVTGIRFGDRETKFAAMDGATMLAEIQRLDEACALKQVAAGGPGAAGVTPRRRAIQLGARRGRVLPPYTLVTRNDGE